MANQLNEKLFFYRFIIMKITQNKKKRFIDTIKNHFKRNLTNKLVIRFNHNLLLSFKIKNIFNIQMNAFLK